MQVVEETVKKKVRLNADEYRLLHQKLTYYHLDQLQNTFEVLNFINELLLKAFELGQVNERKKLFNATKIRSNNRSKIAAKAFNRAFIYDPLMGPAPEPDKTPESEKPCCEAFLSAAIHGCPCCSRRKAGFSWVESYEAEGKRKYR